MNVKVRATVEFEADAAVQHSALEVRKVLKAALKDTPFKIKFPNNENTYDGRILRVGDIYIDDIVV